MEWSEIVRTRRMCRDYTEEPVASELLDRLLDQATRVPSAGFSQGVDFVVLEGSDTAIFWDHTLPASERAGFRWPGLLHAPVVVLPLVDAGTYLERYSQPDKAPAGLGADPDAWPVPYWYIDGGMSVMALLYAAVDAGLGALFFGIFRNEAALLRDLNVPEGKRALGVLTIGYPSEAARRAGREGSPSRRVRRPLNDVVHRSSW